MLLTSEAAAEKLGITVETLRNRARRAGVKPAKAGVGRSHPNYYKLSDIKALGDGKTTKTTKSANGVSTLGDKVGQQVARIIDDALRQVTKLQKS